MLVQITVTTSTNFAGRLSEQDARGKAAKFASGSDQKDGRGNAIAAIAEIAKNAGIAENAEIAKGEIAGFAFGDT